MRKEEIEKVSDKLKCNINLLREMGFNKINLNDYYTSVMKIIEDIHLCDNSERWIPVSEGLPDEHKEVRDIYNVESLALVDTESFLASDLVLVTVKDNEKDELFVSDDVIVDGKWSNFGAMDTFDVIAWKPMPEPYKEEKK